MASHGSLGRAARRDGEDRSTPDAGAQLRGALLDALGEAVIATDLDGRILYWNDAARRLYGWPAEEALGRPIVEVTPALEWRGEAEHIMDTLRRGSAWSGQFITRHRDGHEFPVMVTDTPIRDDDGELIAIVGVSRDASHAWQAEAALRETGDRLSLVRRAARAAIWEYDPAADRLRWSSNLQELLGYSRDDIEPSLDWWHARIHPDDRSRLEQRWKLLLDGTLTSWTEEYRVLRPDGRYAAVSDQAYVSRDEGGALRVAGAIRDLTDRRRMEDERRLLAQASMILDLSVDYEATLPTVARLLTNVVADLCVVRILPTSNQPAFTASAHDDPADHARLAELLATMDVHPPESSVTGRVVRSGEPALLTDPATDLDGDDPDAPLVALFRHFGLDMALVVPLRARSQVMGYMVLGRVSGGWPHPEEVEVTADELARRIGMAVDHARLYQSEQLARRAKDNFLAIVSHELRTPLTAILGYSDLLAAEIPGPLNEKQKGQVQRIHAGTNRLHGILESILAYVRLESGQADPRMEAVPLGEILARVKDIAEPRAVDDGVAFRLETNGVPPRIVTDPDWLLQILLALVTNALKFTREGEVSVHVTAEDDHLVVDVRDSGPGIPVEVQSYIFNPFWQAEQPATRRAGGAGLGLSVARRLARLLDGDVTVADSSPAGTTFRFRAPIIATP